MPGIRTSVIRTSGESSPTARSIASSRCSARSKLRDFIPAWLSAFSSTQRTDWSSSTTQTYRGLLDMAIHRHLLQGDTDQEHGSSRPAFKFYESAVSTD